MAAISARELWRTFGHIGLLSFGGPAGQIALMHRILVEEKRWISEERFLHALNYCMLLPGPEAQQLCTYCGWLLRGTSGGILAGALFVLPGFLAMLVCSLLFVYLGEVSLVQAIFYGLTPAVIALVVAALWRIGGRALRHPLMWALALASWLALASGLSFPLMVLIAALLGVLLGRWKPQLFQPRAHATHNNIPEPLITEEQLTQADPTWQRALRVASFWLALWLLPVVGLQLLGFDHVFAQIGRFFSTVAVVTLGGAYAVLPYMAEHAVRDLGWLSEREMLAGLGLAESTPGPLIMVVQWVGFLAAWHRPEGGSPLVMALLGAVITTWVTFIPSYLWIFVGAPQVERLRQVTWVHAALGAVSAAVVGVIAKLAWWFGLHVLCVQVTTVELGPLQFPWPLWAAGFDLVACALALAASLALIRFRLGIFTVLSACVLVGAGLHLVL